MNGPKPFERFPYGRFWVTLLFFSVYGGIIYLLFSEHGDLTQTESNLLFSLVTGLSIGLGKVLGWWFHIDGKTKDDMQELNQPTRELPKDFPRREL